MGDGKTGSPLDALSVTDRSRWFGWLETHCTSCGGTISRLHAVGKVCPHSPCLKLVHPVDEETLPEHLGTCWRNKQGPPWRPMGHGWGPIRAFMAEYVIWYAPGTSVTSLQTLDAAMEELLRELLHVGG